MLLFLKCHKVSLEAILENQEKNSSGCFAWSWKVSVPKKVAGKMRREKKGGGERENCSPTAPEPALQIVPKPVLCVATGKALQYVSRAHFLCVWMQAGSHLLSR